ncbi:hypothetical protein KC315_g3719 [Hortaea werneckii]|nr:hypothetical protein KC315_g3719 [Hortaea werneckii]
MSTTVTSQNPSLHLKGDSKAPINGEVCKNPDEKTDAQAKAQIPRPMALMDQRKWQLEQMAGAFRIFAKLGFADGGSGHISLRDPVEPSTFWINPYAVHFGLLTVSDMVAHIQWSLLAKIITDSCMFYNDLAVYSSFGGVVFAPEEGSRIAAALGTQHKNIILKNHGLLTCGGTVAEAAAFFIALERACQTQLLTEAAIAPGSVGAGNGLEKSFIGDEEASYTKQSTGNPEVMYKQFEPEYQLIVKETGGDFLN